jgi:hypothetical protein
MTPLWFWQDPNIEQQLGWMVAMIERNAFVRFCLRERRALNIPPDDPDGDWFMIK